jgi:predicted porin
MMQKKILVVAVAAAMAAPLAFADTSIYGKADMALAITDNGSTNTTQVSSQVTKLGFKGAEDLGGGTSAIWQIEQQIDIDAAGSGTSTHTTFAGRNSFAGLKGDSWGTVLLGRHDTPYKIATRGLDVFGDQLADNRSLMGGASGGAHDARLGDVVAYISPSMSGFTAAVAYVAGAENAFASGAKKGTAWSLAGLYGDGPIFVSLAYQTITYGDAGTGTLSGGAFAGDDKFDAFKIGGSYKMDALKLNAVYENVGSSGSGIGDALDQHNYYLSGVYDLGGDDIKLAYGKAGDKNSMSGTGASQVSVGYDHMMSKNTSLYAQYTNISNDSNAAYGITQAGSTAGISAAGAGKDPSAWAFGLKTSF